jgi:ubiquinone/menaquinone biosynthesis C-methylase UbiE
MSKPADKIEVAAAYNRWAGTYDKDPNRTRELAAAVLRRERLELNGRHVVEVGCGTGNNTLWLAERAASVVALDFSEGMLRQARARVHSPHVRFVQHDVRFTWPLADTAADLVVAMLVLEHIEHIEPIFKEAARILRGDGELFLCELHPARQMSGRQAEFTDRESGEHVRVPAFLHDVSEYVNVGLGCGFELLRLGEWRDPDALPNTLPRILSVRLRLRAGI